MDYTTQLYRDYDIAIIRIPSSTNEDFMVHVIQTGFGDCYGAFGGSGGRRAASGKDGRTLGHHAGGRKRAKSPNPKKPTYENLPEKKSAAKLVVEKR